MDTQLCIYFWRRIGDIHQGAEKRIDARVGRDAEGYGGVWLGT